MPPALQTGTRVAGRYVIERLIGKGGMGAVYEARHEELGKVVALKVLLPEVAKEAEVVTRFFREARTAAAIHHPGIVEVFDLGRDGELAFIVMEKLEGEELAERISHGGPLGPRFVALVGVEIAEAISAAHAQGVIHRDLKPQNVFLAQHGRDQEVVKILDFGIAKLADSQAAESLTQTGEIFGTPLYMPPEQLQARKDIDARADVYAIGVILYEALCGSPPYRADSYPALVLKIVDGKPPPLSEARRDLPPALVAVVEKAMAANRDDRFPSAAAMASELYDVAQSLPEDPVTQPIPVPKDLRPPEAGADGLERTAPRMSPSMGPGRSLVSFSKPATPRPGEFPGRATGPTPMPGAPRGNGRLLLGVGAVLLLAAGAIAWSQSLTPSPAPMVPPKPVVLTVPPPAPELPDAAVLQVVEVPAPVPDPSPVPVMRKTVPVKKPKPGEEAPPLLPR